MVIGCGIDIEEIARFEKYFDQPERDSFFNMVFSEREIIQNELKNPRQFFPLGFTCKEAFFKALGISWTNSPIDWKEIEVIFSADFPQRKPIVELSGFALEFFKQKKIQTIELDYHINEHYVYFEILLLS